MEELIMKIIELEDKAQEIISDAKKADSELEENIAEKTKELEEDIEKRAKKREEYLKNVEETETEEKIAAIKKGLDGKIAALEDKYKANREAWINRIVENVIGRQMS